jgi:hypothetical protein
MPRTRGKYWVHSDPAAADPQPAQHPCPGWHNDYWRRADETTRGEPAYGAPVWCEGCTTRLRASLAYLPHLARALEQELEDATDTAGQRVSGTREHDIHAHQAQAFAIDEIRNILGQFEDEVRAQRGFTPRDRRVTRQASIDKSAAFLGTHLEWILTRFDEADEADGLLREFIDRVHRLDRRGMRLTHQDEARPEPCVGVPCKRCDVKALVRAVDRTGARVDEVTCQYCNAKLTLEEYVPWAAQWGVYEHAHLDDAQRTKFAAAVAAYEKAKGIKPKETAA